MEKGQFGFRWDQIVEQDQGRYDSRLDTNQDQGEDQYEPFTIRLIHQRSIKPMSLSLPRGRAKPLRSPRVNTVV